MAESFVPITFVLKNSRKKWYFGILEHWIGNFFQFLQPAQPGTRVYYVCPEELEIDPLFIVPIDSESASVRLIFFVLNLEDANFGDFLMKFGTQLCFGARTVCVGSGSVPAIVRLRAKTIHNFWLMKNFIRVLQTLR